MPCGCRIESVLSKAGGYEHVITWCPLHSSAEALRDALRGISEASAPGGVVNQSWVHCRANEALAQAEGKQFNSEPKGDKQ